MKRTEPFAFVRDLATRWDAVALVIVLGLLVVLGHASRDLLEPLAKLKATPISLDPSQLPYYAARSTLRMFAALGVSLLFTFTYATWAAKSPRVGKLLVPILDILQSVPILSFMTITVVFFMSLAPGRVVGAEFAAIFLVFTSQAWNMAFSFYQSLRTVPQELRDAARSFHLSSWMTFWQVEVPFALPGLIWNTMMSMSGGWFFVVASEALTVGHTTLALPGIGTYIAAAIEQRDLTAIGWAIAAMLVVILLYDQLLFRPLVAWADRLKFEQDASGSAPTSWALTMMQHSRLLSLIRDGFFAAVRWSSARVPAAKPHAARDTADNTLRDRLFLAFVIAIVVLGLWRIAADLIANTTMAEALKVCGLSMITMVRVFVFIGLASLIWVPIGVWVGLRPRVVAVVQPVAQFMAAFPAQLLFPFVVSFIVRWKLTPDIWLSPLMILGTQWYILFNVIAGASAIPGELRYAAENFNLRGWQWWKTLALPAIFPYYITGAITASGGSWNAAFVAEYTNWGSTQVSAHGVGAYLARASADGDFHGIMLGTVTMCLFVVIINRFFWRPLYYYAERRYRLA